MTNLKSNFHIVSEHCWRISGVLTFSTVPAIEVECAKSRANLRAKLEIDCLAVTKIDSSGLAWMLENIRELAKKDISVKLLNLPSQAQTLAQIHGIETLLFQDQHDR